jgi:hypothetical protein
MLVGDEPFHDGGKPLPFTVTDFWRWGVANLTGNALRGIVAEFLVARALGESFGVRVEWDAVDLRTSEGAAVEIKCSGYVQTWAQQAPSRPSFDIAAKRSWDAATNTYATAPGRPADVYVFALHHHRERATVDPRDVSQWSFYIVPTVVLDEAFAGRKRLGLAQLEKITRPVPYRDIARAVGEAAKLRHGTA